MASSSGLSIQSSIRQRSSPISPKSFQSKRLFSSAQAWWSDLIKQDGLRDSSIDKEATLGEESAADVKETHQSSPSTPWYLQVGPPQRVLNPLLDRQQIPQLPPDPPPLLKPILEHISIDLGLDDLTVFDLRKIDPPPALGANVLMVLGTARSEKHLHVSADRFCRWLKVTHKLSPYADGLLGRGELKLKLRRKARRAKLLSNVGSSEAANADDGLRTGWICVNVGIVDDGNGPVESFLEQEGYAGFGGDAGGAKVVIQMLTEEKREELDLEDLWGKMLRRQERKEGRLSQGQGVLLPVQEVGHHSLQGERSDPDSRSFASSSLPKRANPYLNQFRHYSSRSISPPLRRVPSTERYFEEPNPRDLANAAQKADKASTKEVIPKTKRYVLLHAHVTFVQILPRYYAIKVLGNDTSDRESTSFLDSFYRSYPNSPTAQEWKCRLGLVSHGISIGHSGYNKKKLAALTREMLSTLTAIPADVFLLLLGAFLTRSPPFRTYLTKESIQSAMSILIAMRSHGHSIQTRPQHEKSPRHILLRGLRFVLHHPRHPRRVSRSAPDRLGIILDNLHSSLHQSPCYAECLNMLVANCVALSKKPSNEIFDPAQEALRQDVRRIANAKYKAFVPESPPILEIL